MGDEPEKLLPAAPPRALTVPSLQQLEELPDQELPVLDEGEQVGLLRAENAALGHKITEVCGRLQRKEMEAHELRSQASVL